MLWATQTLIDWTERGLLPDRVIRQGIRLLSKQRLESLNLCDCEHARQGLREFIQSMDNSPIALLPEKANEQHYELPQAFFGKVLGPHRKYSSAYWPEGISRLEDAEAAALEATGQRADLQDGQDVLELGCGWGSLTLWTAQRFPNSRILAVSNSHSQREFILQQALHRGLSNIEVMTCDMNQLTLERRFDRVVSVEMFEHMRNWRRLFELVAHWLQPGGKFFMHIFCHRDQAYTFDIRDESDWMSRYFFSGGIMPCDSLPLYFQRDLKLTDHWRWDGRHYEKTANAWLRRMDSQADAIMPILADTYGEADARLWWTRWRIFFMACAELFGYAKGQQWWVSHYLFAKP